MLYNSILNFFFCFFCIFLAVDRCGFYCPYGYTYFWKSYELFIYLYICYSILLATQLLQGMIAVNRLLAFSKKKYKYLSMSANVFRWLGPVVIVASFALYAVNILINRYVKKFGLVVVSNNTYQVLYKVAQRDLPDWFKDVLFLLNVMQNIVLQITLFLIDMLIMIKLVLFIRQKKSRVLQKSK